MKLLIVISEFRRAIEIKLEIVVRGTIKKQKKKKKARIVSWILNKVNVTHAAFVLCVRHQAAVDDKLV